MLEHHLPPSPPHPLPPMAQSHTVLTPATEYCRPWLYRRETRPPLSNDHHRQLVKSRVSKFILSQHFLLVS